MQHTAQTQPFPAARLMPVRPLHLQVVVLTPELNCRAQDGYQLAHLVAGGHQAVKIPVSRVDGDGQGLGVAPRCPLGQQQAGEDGPPGIIGRALGRDAACAPLPLRISSADATDGVLIAVPENI